jgi:hypothetical protein
MDKKMKDAEAEEIGIVPIVKVGADADARVGVGVNEG